MILEASVASSEPNLFDILNIILLIVVAVATSIPVYYMWTDRRLKVDVLLFKEYLDKPINSTWSLKIIGINRTLKRANIWLNETQLRWTHVDNLPFERYFEVNHTENIRIPSKLEKTAKTITIKDGSKVVKKFNYKDIPTDKQYS